MNNRLDKTTTKLAKKILNSGLSMDNDKDVSSFRPGFQAIIRDAEAAGFEVFYLGKRTVCSVRIVSRWHKGNGRVVQGADLFESGDALTLHVPGYMALSVRKLSDVREMVGL